MIDSKNFATFSVSSHSQEISNIPDCIRYIRTMLGEPLIQVELTDEHILHCIMDTVKMYTDVAYGFTEVAETLNLNETKTKRYLKWDEVQKVTDSGGKKSIPFKWDSIKRILTILSDSTGTAIVVGLQRYQVDFEFDLIFNESWIKEMAKAKTQLLWGQTLGKYSQNLVGGATINYDRIITEAQSDIERLTEELQEKWQDPAPVLVG